MLDQMIVQPREDAASPEPDWTTSYEADVMVAIEAFLAAERRERPETLTYRSVDLSTAVQRHLYALLTCDRAAQAQYAIQRAGDPTAGPDLEEPDVLAVMGHLLPQRAARLRLAPPAPATRLRAIGRRTPGLWPIMRRLRHRPATGAASGRPILAVVHHPKFVRYLSPIAEAMPGQVALMTYDRGRFADDVWDIAEADRAGFPIATPNASHPAARRWPDLCVTVAEMAAALERHRPRCVFVAEGDPPYQELLALVARAHGVPSLCLQWGGFPFAVPHIRNMSHSTFLAWGEGFVDQLRPVNPGLRFEAVGNHIIQPNIEPPGKRLLCLLQGVDHYNIRPSDWAQFLEFLNWVANAFPEWQIVVRPHPSLPLDPTEAAALMGHKNVVMEHPAEHLIADSLRGVALAITLSSSAILDAMAQGAVPFLFNPTRNIPRFQPDLTAWGAGIEEKTLADAKRAIARLLTDAGPGGRELTAYRLGLEKFRKYFFAATGKQALKNIVRVLAAAIDRTDFAD